MALNAFGRPIQVLMGSGKRAGRDLSMGRIRACSKQHQGRTNCQHTITRPGEELAYCAALAGCSVSAAGFHPNCNQPLGHQLTSLLEPNIGIKAGK
jgi:hypothetical protein